MNARWFMLIVITLITVVIWIGMEVFMNLSQKPLRQDYTHHLNPISPKLQENVIDEILKRETDNFLVKRDNLK